MRTAAADAAPSCRTGFSFYQGTSPCQRLSLHEPYEGVGDEAEHSVHDEPDEDHVGLSVRPCQLHHVADATGGVDLLDHDEGEPRPGHREPQSEQEARQCARQHHVPHEPGTPQADRLGEFDVAAVDAAQPVVGVDVDRHEHPERDGDDLHRLADAEPQDQQRNQCERGNRPLNLHGPVDEPLADPAQPRHQREREPGQHAEHQAKEGALGGDGEVRLEPALGDEVASGARDDPRSGQVARVDQPRTRACRPYGEQQERAERPAVGDGPSGSEPLADVGTGRVRRTVPRLGRGPSWTLCSTTVGLMPVHHPHAATASAATRS